jgi:D-psicose/D-tagatose/L-ribulose 3-epimerase
MKIGMNMLLWTLGVEEQHRPVLAALSEAGYDGIEAPVLSGDKAYYETLARWLSENGLEATGVTVIPDEEHSCISSEKANRQRAVDYLKWAVDMTRAMGGSVLCGPMHQPIKAFSGAPPTADEQAWAAEVHRAVGEHAAEAGVTLAVEYLNRFECHFINTMADAVAHVRRVDHPNVRTMYDSFHANIEEKDPVAIIEPNIDAIAHVHLSENDRGVLGAGHTPQQQIIDALQRVGYDDWLTVEAFGQDVQGIVEAANVWRPFFDSKEAVYQQSLSFIKQALGQSATASN